MRFTIVTTGAMRAAWRIRDLGTQAGDLRPAMEEIYMMILEIEDEIFESQGERGGRIGWEPLTLGWITYKFNHPTFDPRTLHMTRLLRESVTRWRHPEQYTRIEKHKIVFRSQREFAELHRKGKGGMPKREFIYFTKQDAVNFSNEIKKHIVTLSSGGPPASA